MSHNAEPRMNKLNTAEQRGPVKGRKIVVVLLCFLPVAALLLYITAYFLLNSERMRSELEGHLTAMVGLPARIDALGIRFFPNPGVALRGVRIGPEDAHLDADVCEAFFDLRSLTRGELRFTDAYVRTATLALPGTPLLAADRLDMLVDVMREHQAQRRDVPPSWMRIEIDAVTVRQMRVMLGDVVLAAGEARLDNATSPQVDVLVAAALLPLGDGSQLKASARFTRRKGAPLGVSGDAALTFRKAFALNRGTLLPEIAVEGHVSFAGDSMDDIALTLAGSALVGSDAAPVQGAFTANAWWQRDAFIINDLRWQSPGFILHADATIPVRKAEPAMHIHNATLGMPLMQTAVDLLAPPSLRLLPKSDAAVVVTDLLAGLSFEPLPRLASGEIMITGVSVINAAGQPLLDDVRIAAEVEEGRLRLRQLTGGDWTADGWIAPDAAAHRIAFEIRATGNVDKARLALLAPALARKMDEVGAALELTEVTGAYIIKQKRFEVLNCAGILSHGRMAYRHTETAPLFFLDDMSVLFRYEDASVHLDELRFGNSVLRGKAHVDANQPPRVDLAGTIHLADVPSAVLPPGLSLRDMEGRFDATSLSVVVPHDAPLQASLSGALQDAGMIIEAAAFHDRLSGISGAISVENDKARFTLTGSSERLGWLSATGECNIAAGSATGEAVLDLGAAAGNLMGDVPWRVPAAGVIAESYGQTSLAFDMHLPQAPDEVGAAKLRRQEPPAFYVEAALHRDDAGGVYLGGRQLDAAIPLPLVVKHLNLHRETVQAWSFPVETEGLLHVRYEQNTAQTPYLLTLDATDCAARLQPWLHKAPGVSLRVSVQGAERGRTIDLLLDRQRITMYDEGTGNYQAREVDVALDKLARLFPQEITPAGNVQLSFGSAPLYMRAQLRDTEVTFAPDIRFGVVNGVAEYGADALHLRDVTVRGGGFDCRLNMTRGGGAWDAILEGARVDVNRLRDINETLARLRGHESPREAGITMPNATGTLRLRLGEAAYRRGAIRQVAGTAQISPEIITIEDFSCLVGRGTASGRVRIQPERTERSPATDGPRRRAVIYANLRIDGADVAQAEQLLFEQPRDLAGRAWGTAEAQLPTGKEGFRRMDGKFQLQLRDGSLGRLGFATRLTSILRNMEIVRLRMPSLQDEGLTYDNASVNIVMRDGLAQLNDCTATSPSYTVEAAGLVDFGRMHTDVQVRMSLFDAVTGLMEHVPIIGPTATTALREATRIRLRATGPPFDIRWQPDILP